MSSFDNDLDRANHGWSRTSEWITIIEATCQMTVTSAMTDDATEADVREAVTSGHYEQVTDWEPDLFSVRLVKIQREQSPD